MRKHSVDKLIFSSTAAVYGEPPSSPITEDFPLQPSNPYGESKLAFEKILKWYHASFDFKYISLRYFNAAGAYGDAGEDHQPESHLIPIVLQAAQGKRNEITIFGDDYKTPDGTCVRDYIHVRDLADAHVKALEALAAGHNSEVFNLGQGTGSSVKEVIEAARKITGKTISSSVSERRAGDPSTLVASNAKIGKQLGWSPRFSQIDTIIEDAWAWHQAHPFGYGKSK
jgi:UDP-glucose 4-epimerase